MDAAYYTALCEGVARKPLGSLGLHLGQGMAAHLPSAGINTSLRLAHFVAQASHETDSFSTMIEYGDKHYFSRYDGRRDLGNTQPGDGYRFRGRGIFQLTGRANYEAYGKRLGLDLLGDPDQAADPQIAVWTATLYWNDHGLSHCADLDGVIAITRYVNGGLNGLSDREAALARAKAYLTAHPAT